MITPKAWLAPIFLLLHLGSAKTIEIDIDKDFDYIPQGWPGGLSTSQTAAVGLSNEPYEILIGELSYISEQVLYGYLTLGNSQDNKYSFVVDDLENTNYIVYVDINNNEDLTDDGGPFQNEGTGKFAANVSFNVEIILSNGKSISRPYLIWLWVIEHAGGKEPRFYAKCHYKSLISIGEEEYTAVAFENRNHNVLYKENGLYIDLNRDGQFDENEENFKNNEIIPLDDEDYILKLNYP